MPEEATRVHCARCGKFANQNAPVINGKQYCRRCRTLHFSKCSKSTCSTWAVSGKLYRTRRQGGVVNYCKPCAEEHTFVCHYCARRKQKSLLKNQTIDPQKTVCTSCFNGYYSKCGRKDCTTVAANSSFCSVKSDDGWGGVFYCKSCRDEHTFECSYCGNRKKHGALKEQTTVSGKVCKACFNSHFRKCYKCKELHGTNKLKQFDGYYYCGPCGKSVFDTCDGCRESAKAKTLQTYKSKKYCAKCGGFRNEVLNYSYIPQILRFHGNTKDKTALTLGMELEAQDNGAYHSECFRKFRKHTGNLFYFKSDSSIGGGVEFVTHPFTFNWFRKNMKTGLKEVLDYMKEAGWRSYDASSCGIHIHMNKDAFTTAHLLKFLEFFYYHQTYVIKISQRGRTGLGYCSFSDHAEGGGLKYKAETKGGTQKYTAVSLSKRDTAEVRIFRGNLHFPSVMKNIEFCVAVFEYTKQRMLKKVSMVGFNKFVKRRAKDFPNLWNFIIDKKLTETKYTKPTSKTN